MKSENDLPVERDKLFCCCLFLFLFLCLVVCFFVSFLFVNGFVRLGLFLFFEGCGGGGEDGGGGGGGAVR